MSYTPTLEPAKICSCLFCTFWHRNWCDIDLTQSFSSGCMLLNICSAHTSPCLSGTRGRAGWCREFIQAKAGRQNRLTLCLDCAVSLVTSSADQLSSQTLCHPFLPAPSHPASFAACSSTCPLSMVYHLQPLFPTVLPFLPRTKLWRSVVSALLLLFTGGPICSANPLEQRLPYCRLAQCPPHKRPNAIWALSALLNQPVPCTGTAVPSLPRGCDKVILAPAADALSEGPAEITAHTGTAWLMSIFFKQ